MSTEFCDECNDVMVKIGEHKNTRLFMCNNCFAEKVKYVENKPCKHEYDDKSGNKCTQCGEASIHYA